MRLAHSLSAYPRPASPYASSRDILVAAEGADMTALARQLLAEGHRVHLRTSIEAALDYLSKGRRPSVAIIDPDQMPSLISTLSNLRVVPAIVAATGERRPQRLIEALNANVYSAWISRPCSVSEIYPVIIERLDRQEAIEITNGLTATLMLATRDMLHAARHGGKMKDLHVKGAMDIAAASEDYRALQNRDLFYCPTRMGVWALFGPMRERWLVLTAAAGLSVIWADFPTAKVYCDAPLARRALRVILAQAVHYAGERGSVTLKTEADMANGGLILKCYARRAVQDPAKTHQNYRAFAETFTAQIAKMHGGVFEITERRRDYIQSLHLPNNAPMPDKPQT